MEPIVCTFLWGLWFDGEGYVRRLINNLRKHSNIPFQFVIFADSPHISMVRKYADRVIPIKWNWMRNLKKLQIFNPSNGFFPHQVICIDLDVCIVGNVDDILNWKGMFSTCKGAVIDSMIGGSITSHNAGEIEFREYMWNDLMDANAMKYIEQETNGAERKYFRMKLVPFESAYPGTLQFWDHIFPGQILSFKRDCRPYKELPNPNNTRIIRFHGNPRPHECKKEWVRRYWNES